MAPVLTAALLLLCFPPVGWHWAAYFALVPAGVLAARSDRPRLLVVSLMVTGALWWFWAGRWMLPVTAPGHVTIAVAAGVIWGLGFLLARWLNRGWGVPMILALPLGYTAMELFRAEGPLGGFNWFTLAASQAAWQPGDAGRIVQIADLFGWPLVSVTVGLFNGLWIDLVTRPIYRPREGRRRPLAPSTRWSLMGTSAFAVAVWLYGGERLHEFAQVTTPGPRVGVVQTNVPQDNKNHRTYQGDRKIWEDLRGLTARLTADASPPDWILWPETCLPAGISPHERENFEVWVDIWTNFASEQISTDEPFWREYAEQQGVTLETLPSYRAAWDAMKVSLGDGVRDIAASHGVWLIAGVPHQDEDRPDGSPGPGHNSVVVIRPDGTMDPERYDKIGLVPFGEYMPLVQSFPALKQWFLNTLSPYSYDYSLQPGKGPVFFQLSFRDARGEPLEPDPSSSTQAPVAEDESHFTEARAATPICFEDTQPERVRSMVYQNGEKRTDVLLNVTNDGWFCPRPLVTNAGGSVPVGAPLIRWLVNPGGQAEQHLQIASLRCIENRVPMVRAVNTGVSGLIDSNGGVSLVLEADGQRVGVAAAGIGEVAIDERLSVFGRVGMWPARVVSLITVFLGILGAFRMRRHARTTQGDEESSVVAASNATPKTTPKSDQPSDTTSAE